MTDGLNPQGVPQWLAASLNYCSRCGTALSYGPLPAETRDRLACTNCGFIAYVNPRVVVSTIPVTDDGGLILLRRAIEPGYGSWAQPGGFLEIDETAHEGAIRETIEETGLLVDPTEIVGVYSRPQAAGRGHLLGGAHHRRHGPGDEREPRGPNLRPVRDPLAACRLSDDGMGTARLASVAPSHRGDA